MDLKNDPTVIRVTGRINFPHLYEPETDPFGRTRYSVVVRLYDPKDWEAVENAKKAAWQKKDPVNWERMLKKTNADPKCCLLRTPDNFDELEPGERFKELLMTRRVEDGMPRLVDRARRDVPQSAGLFVSGAKTFNLGQVWAYTGKGSTGCSCTALGLQWLEEGPAFGGNARKASTDDFEVLDSGDNGDDPFNSGI